MLLALQHARCCQHDRRWTTATVPHTSLVVSGGVDCGRKRQNVYDNKPQRYAKDNRTAHLTARSDKSVAYVTNNKGLYSTFCTIEANYWQTRSIARPLCDSRAACYVPQNPVVWTVIFVNSYSLMVVNKHNRTTVKIVHVKNLDFLPPSILSGIRPDFTFHFCRQTDRWIGWQMKSSV